MGFGDFLKNAVGGGQRVVAQVQNKDLLEGIASGALYLAASGGISKDEADQLAVSLSTNKALSAFSPSAVAAVVDRFRQQIENSPRMAKLAIKKEVEECSNNPEWGETIVAIALDVADSDGELSEDEVTRARELCGWAKQPPSKFGL